MAAKAPSLLFLGAPWNQRWIKFSQTPKERHEGRDQQQWETVCAMSFLNGSLFCFGGLWRTSSFLREMAFHIGPF